MQRRKTRPVKVGSVQIGGLAPISIQSMTKTHTSQILKTVSQIKKLEEAGCQIIRCAVPDEESAKAIKKIKSKINIPLVADIHFDYRLAIASIENGADKIRINPGNIGGLDKVEMVIRSAKKRHIPIRIGVNSGSLEKEYVHVNAENMVKSVLKYVKIFEKFDFTDIVISIKAASVPMTIEAYQLLAKKVDYPFHVGITESGTIRAGTIRSSVGIGALLAQGIGDTIRVSLTADPIEEIKVGKEILKSLELFSEGLTIISCPTCGRCEVNIIDIAQKIEDKTKNIKKPLKVAVMGCSVNGPGEAKESDIGLAAGRGVGLIFKGGKILRKVKEKEMVSAVVDEINKLAGGQK